MYLVVIEGFFLYLCYYKHKSTNGFMFILVLLFPLYLLRTRSPESKPKYKNCPTFFFPIFHILFYFWTSNSTSSSKLILSFAPAKWCLQCNSVYQCNLQRFFTFALQVLHYVNGLMLEEPKCGRVDFVCQIRSLHVLVA